MWERGMHPDLIAAAMSGNAEQSAGGLLRLGEAVGGGMGALLRRLEARPAKIRTREAMRRSGAAKIALDAGAGPLMWGYPFDLP